jgi:hypothetical protein
LVEGIIPTILDDNRKRFTSERVDFSTSPA